MAKIWKNTTKIERIDVPVDKTNFAAGSKIQLYPLEVIEINKMDKSFGSIIVRNIKTIFNDNLDNLELIATTFVAHTRDGIMPVSFRNLENGSDYSTVVLGMLSGKRYVAINYWMEAKDEIIVWIPPSGEDFSVALFKKKAA